MQPENQYFWDQILEENKIRSSITKRAKDSIVESIKANFLDAYLSENWVIDKKFARTIRMRKPKSHDLIFEDRVWSLVAKLGFKVLNKDRNFRLPYSSDRSLTQQIDVFAADKETILLIECKSCDGDPKRGNFKTDIEAIGGKKEGLIKELRKVFKDTKPKFKFIFATNNYILSEPDKERLENYGITHFDEEQIEYYLGLVKHLGNSARFQFLGNLFEGQEIPES